MSPGSTVREPVRLVVRTGSTVRRYGVPNREPNRSRFWGTEPALASCVSCPGTARVPRSGEPHRSRTSSRRVKNTVASAVTAGERTNASKIRWGFTNQSSRSLEADRRHTRPTHNEAIPAQFKAIASPRVTGDESPRIANAESFENSATPSMRRSNTSVHATWAVRAPRPAFTGRVPLRRAGLVAVSVEGRALCHRQRGFATRTTRSHPTNESAS